MSTSGSVSRRYARALVEIGVETKKLQALLNELARIAGAVEASIELRDALRNPIILPLQRKKILESLVKRLGISQPIRNLCMILVDRGRAHILPHIHREFQSMVDEHEGVLRAEVLSAGPLSKGYLDKLTKALSNATGKKVDLSTKQDRDLIGGVVTRIGGIVYDGSLRSRISRVREQIIR